MKLWRIVIILALTLALSPEKSQARTYNVGMIHWIAYSTLNVADVKGFWKEAGIDVKVINYTSNQNLNDSLLAKRIDIALDMLGSWVGMYMDGAPLKIIGETDWSHGGDKIIVKKDLDMKNFKNETVGVYLNQPSVTYFLNMFLAKNNIKLSDLKIQELETEPLAKFFIDNRFKVIVSYDPQAIKAEKDGNGKLAATSADFAGVIPEGFVAREDVLAGIPKEDLLKFYKGWLKAVEWSKNKANFAEYMKIINEKTFEGESPYSEKDIKDMLGSVKIHDKASLRERNKTGVAKYLNDLKKFLKDNNLLKKDFEPAALFDTAAINEALK